MRMWGRAACAASLIVSGVVVPLGVEQASAATTAPVSIPGGYVPLAPTRVDDTATSGRVRGGVITSYRTWNFDPAGDLGIGSYGTLDSSAVPLNVTVSAPTNDGYLTVWAGPGARPSIPTMFFTHGTATSHLTVLPADGPAEIFNGSGGQVRVIVDAVGYLLGGGGGPGALNGLESRVLLNTSTGVGAPARPLLGKHAVTVRIPSTVAAPGTAVLLDASVRSPGATGRLGLYPAGARTLSTGLAFTRGQQSSNDALVTVPSSGAITVENMSAAPAGVVLSLEAVVPPGASGPGVFHPLPGREVLDTGLGLGLPKRPLAAGTTNVLAVAGRAGLPSGGIGMAAVELVTSSATGSGYLSVFGAGQTDRGAFSLDYARGAVRSNLYLAPVSASGAVDIRVKGTGNVRVQAFVEGYTTAATEVVGHVHSSGGRSVAAMRVTLTDARGPAQLTTTDGFGRFVIGVDQPGPFRLCVSGSPTGGEYPATGYADTCSGGGAYPDAPYGVTVSPGRSTAIDLTVRPGGEFYGTVTDASGHAIPGGTLTDLRLGGSQYSGEVSNGSYRLTGLPPGAYTVCLSGNDPPPALPGYVKQCSVITLASGTERRVDARLAPGAGFTGTVTHHTTDYMGSDLLEAVQGGSVVAYGTVNPDGTYSLGGVPPGTTTLCVSPAPRLDLRACYSTDPSGAATSIDAVAGQVRHGFDIDLPEGGEVGGLISIGGAPATGATVTLTNDSTGRVASYTTDTHGRYLFGSVSLGDHTVCASAPGHPQVCHTDGQGNPAPVVVTAGVGSTVDLAI